MPNDFVKWGRTGNQTEPPLTKRNAGAKAGRPEAAQYVNWLLDRLAAGANLDRREDCLLYMPLISNLDIERGVGTATFARASTATYVDRYGVLRAAAVDEPRFEAEGYLSEGSSTNEMLHSEDFANAAWSKVRCSITSGATAGPDGVAGSADKMVEDGTAGATHAITQGPDTAPGDDDIITQSIHAKAAEREWLRISVLKKDGTFGQAWFDLTNGAVGTTQNVEGARIRALADGWYRCEVSADILSGGTTVSARYFLADADGSDTYDGDGSSGVYIWGGQFENDLHIASSYIPTTTAAVTRAADILTVQANGNVGRQAEAGTWFADASILGVSGDSSSQGVIGTEGESPVRSIRAVRNGGDGAVQWDGAIALNGASTPHTMHRYGMVYDGDVTVEGWRDGVLVSDAATVTNPQALGTALEIGDQLYGHIRNVRIYNRALNAQEMAIA